MPKYPKNIQNLIQADTSSENSSCCFYRKDLDSAGVFFALLISFTANETYIFIASDNEIGSERTEPCRIIRVGPGKFIGLKNPLV